MNGSQQKTILIDHPTGSIYLPVTPGMTSAQVVEAAIDELDISNDPKGFVLKENQTNRQIGPGESVHGFPQGTIFQLVVKDLTVGD